MKDDLVNTFLDEANSLEIIFADIYRLFGKLFVEDSDFWNQLTYEELNHAALLRSIKTTVGLSSDLTSGLSDVLLQEIINTKERASYLLDGFSKEPPDRKTAFSTAIEIEKTAGEIHYQEVMSQTTDSWFINILQTLNEYDLDHLKRLERYIQENSIV